MTEDGADGAARDAGPRRSRIGSTALVVAALATGVAITSQAPDTDARQRPFVRAGVMGESVDGRTFQASVVAVRGARRIARSGKTRDTGGDWVIVRARAVARDKPTSIDYASVRDARGRTFLATTRINQPLVAGGYFMQPGIPVEGDIVFEVPHASAARLTLRLADSSDVRMDAAIEISIASDGPTVDRWLAEPSALPVEDARVVE
jgi:hypothetical protein